MPDYLDQSPALLPDPPQAHATVEQIMSHQVVTVAMDDTLARAQALFNEFRFHHLLVVEHDRLVGVISDRDLLKAGSPFTGTMNETARDLATLSKRIHQVMNRALITVDRGTSINYAARLLIDKRISCLPVVTDDGKVEGIVSWRDLLMAYAVPPLDSWMRLFHSSGRRRILPWSGRAAGIGSRRVEPSHGLGKLRL